MCVVHVHLPTHDRSQSSHMTNAMSYQKQNTIIVNSINSITAGKCQCHYKIAINKNLLMSHILLTYTFSTDDYTVYAVIALLSVCYG